jgi:ABC-type glutathione transport system ATPase component
MTPQRYDIQVKVHSRMLVDARDVSVLEGGVTFLFGESGIGKSLAGKALFGLLDSAEYTVRINGEPYQQYLASPAVGAARENGFFVFQEPSSHLNPLQTLQEQLSEGALSGAHDPVAPAGELWKVADRKVLDRILPVYPKPYRPSGGEKQRILCAMAFAKMDALDEHQRDGGLFVFDEPTGSLDREARDQFLGRLFARYRKRPQTIVIITHDYGIIGYVQAVHADLLPAIRYREMCLEGATAQVRPFEPSRYFQWLHEQPQLTGSAEGPVVLQLQSGVRVFGSTMRFTPPVNNGDALYLKIRGGEIVYLKAASGVGKTTIAKIILGLQKAAHMRMKCGTEVLSEATSRRRWQDALWGRMMTMAFQHADEALNPNASVIETLALIPVAELKTEEGVTAALRSLFDEQEIARLKLRKVWQLSGGQKQRLNLLRAFALQTPLIILDEPLSALDFASIDRVLALVREALHRGQAMLLISHNEDIFDALVPASGVYQLTAQVTDAVPDGTAP